MKCPKCGTETNPGAKFCGSCGFDLSSTVQSSVNQTADTTQSFQTTEQFKEPVNEATNPVTNQPMVTENPQPVENNLYQQQVLNQPGLNEQQSKKSGAKTAIIVAIIAVLAVVAAIVGFILLSPNSEEKKEKEIINSMFDPNKLIKVKGTNGKYGYIDSTGKFVLEAKYDTATKFYGDYAIVRTEVEVDGIETSVYQVIDQKGNVKKQGAISIKYLEDLDMWLIDNELYNSSMKLISPKNVKVDEADENYFVWVNSTENTGGIMNEKGKITYTYKFQSGETYINIDPSEIDESLKERYCRVNVENEKYAIVNCDTGVVVQDYITKYIAVSDDNIFTINKENSYEDESKIYIQGDKVAYQTTDPGNVRITHYPGYLYIRDNTKTYNTGMYSYLHLDTLEIKDKRPETTTSDDDDEEVDEWEKYTGYSSIYQNGKYGLSNGEAISLPAEWDSLKYVEINLYKYLKQSKKDYIYGEKDDSWFLIDLSTKKPIKEFKTSYINQSSDTSFMYYTDKETSNKVVFNIISGNTLSVESGTYLTTYSNYVTIKDYGNKTLKYYNTNLEHIYTESL